MNNKFLYLTLAVLAVGCEVEIENHNQELIEEQSGKEVVTIYASLNDETRTTVDGTGVFSWQADEMISVVEEDATSGTDFTLTDAETGAFTGTKSDGKDLVFAVSPKAALTDIDFSGGLVYEISLPDTYTNYVPGTTNSIMVGTPNGGSYKFKFYNAAALMKFTYANVPIGTKKFVYGSTENYLTGSWIFDTTSGVVLDGTTATGSAVTLELAEAVYEANQTLEFCVPVPTATYKDFLIELQDKDGNTISGTDKSKDGLSLALDAGSILPLPTVSLEAAIKGSEWSHTMANDDLGTSGKTLDGLTVTSSVSSSSFESTGNARGEAFSSGADPTITISGYSSYIQSVSVVMSTNAGSDKVTVSVSVDGHAIGSSQIVLDGTGYANTAYTFNVDGTGFRKGDIAISITNTNDSKSTWVQSVSINGDSRESADISYAVDVIEKATGAANFTNPLTNPNSIEGITYSSSDVDVATVNASTGEISIVASGTTTITASFEGNEFYKAGDASYSLTVSDAYLTLPAATSPSKANCTDNSTVSFVVDSNIDWTAAKGADVNSIIKSVSKVGSTVTVTFNANTGVEKTAEVTITPVEAGYQASLTKTMTVTQNKYELVDVLTHAWTGIGTSGSYTAWSDKAGSASSAVYAGQSYPNSGGYIQIRNNSPSGIVSTASGGAVTKVSVVYNTSQSNTGKTLTVYGKNTAYTSSSDLYSPATRGTELGTISYDSSETYLEIGGYYEYVGLLSSGPMYFDEIDIYVGSFKAASGLEWQISGTKTTTDVATMKTAPTADILPTATLYNPNSLTVTYSSSDPEVATINASTGVITLINEGETVISASFAGDETYKADVQSYTLTVTDSRITCATPAFSIAAGAVAADTEVTITSATTGSTIYFTTDGSTPTTASSHGTEGDASAVVTIDVAKTINAIAVKDDCTTSDVATAAYTISGVSVPLPDPSGVSISTISASGFTATWSNDANALSYSWMLSTASTAPASTSDASVVSYGTSSDAALSAGIWTLSKTSLSLSGKYYLYVKAIGDGVSYSDSDYSSKSAITLTFGLTSNPGGWPTTNSTTLTDYTYTLNAVGYTFKLYNVKQNSGYLMLTKTAGLGLPAIAGYKLVKVVASNSSTCSKSVNVGISSTAPTTATYIAGGSTQTWGTTSSSYSYSLTSTSANTVYYLYVTSANAQIVSLELSYLE